MEALDLSHLCTEKCTKNCFAFYHMPKEGSPSNWGEPYGS